MPAHRLTAELESGQGACDSALPFSGYKALGCGRETCRQTLNEYTELKTVVLSLGPPPRIGADPTISQVIPTPTVERRSEMGQPSPAIQGDTFLRAARAGIDDLKPGDIAVLGVPHELTKISRPGTSAGPHAIRQATLLTHYIAERYCTTGAGEALMDVDTRRVYRYDGASVYDLGDLVMTPDLSVNSERITTAVQAIAAAGALPVVLGGDHFLSLPSATGAVHGSDATTALLSLDMHLDLGDRVPDFGTHNGGTWLRRLIEDRVVEPEHVLIYGIESLQILDEWQYASRSGIQVITAHEVWERGVNDTLRPALDRALAGCNGLYATLDIDAGARSTVPGTGNQGGVRGLSPGELLEVCQTVQGSPLVGVDLTELSPPLDLSGATAGLAASMLVTVLWNRLFQEVSSIGISLC